jgi:hypothetical protein
MSRLNGFFAFLAEQGTVLCLTLAEQGTVLCFSRTGDGSLFDITPPI